MGSLRRGALLWDHCVAWHIQMEVDFGGSETIESWRDDPTGLRSWLGEGGKKVTIPGYPGTLNGLTGRQDQRISAAAMSQLLVGKQGTLTGELV